MWSVQILYPDGTLSKKSFPKPPDTLDELMTSVSQGGVPGIIYNRSFYDQPLQHQHIDYIVLHKTLLSGHPDVSKYTHDMLEPVIITPNSMTPALWETSAISTKPEVTLICNKYGRKKRAIYINQSSDEPASHTALIAIDEQDCVIKTQYRQHKFSTTAYRITSIKHSDKLAVLKTIDVCSEDVEETALSYERFYQKHPYLKSVTRSSKRKARKGLTSDIHYAVYQHLLRKKHHS